MYLCGHFIRLGCGSLKSKSMNEISLGSKLLNFHACTLSPDDHLKGMIVCAVTGAKSCSAGVPHTRRTGGSMYSMSGHHHYVLTYIMRLRH